jgi:2'-5' RNA ligase
MLSPNYETVYVGMVIKSSPQLSEAQIRLCSILEMLPRKEFHITLAYFGQLSPAEVNNLGHCMGPLANNKMTQLQIDGLGGAFQDEEGRVHLISSLDDDSYKQQARVLWWSVASNEALIDFRNSLIASAIGLGLPKDSLRPAFFPHVTIGSNGPKGLGGDWDLWDVHSVAKIPTVSGSELPQEIVVDRIHITSVPVQPDSLYVIWR